MSEGLKRTIKYFSRFQLESFVYWLAFALVYGLFLGLLGGHSGEDVTRSMTYAQTFVLFSSYIVQTNYMTCRSSMAVMMGATRKNVGKAYWIMTAMLYAETWLTMAIMRLINPSEGKTPLWFYLICYLLMVSVVNSLSTLAGGISKEPGRVQTTLQIAAQIVVIACIVGMGLALVAQESLMEGCCRFVFENPAPVTALKAGVIGLSVLMLAVFAYRSVKKKINHMEVCI